MYVIVCLLSNVFNFISDSNGFVARLMEPTTPVLGCTPLHLIRHQVLLVFGIQQATHT